MLKMNKNSLTYLFNIENGILLSALTGFFFSLTPTKENISSFFWIIGISFLTFSKKPVSIFRRLYSLIYIPLFTQICIALFQMMKKFFTLEDYDIYSNFNLRSAVSIGPKNASIICVFLLLIKIAKIVKGENKKIDKVFYFLTFACFVLLNSLNGFVSFFLACLFMFYYFKKNSGIKNLEKRFYIFLNLIKIKVLIFVFLFPFSGGLVRFYFLKNSIAESVASTRQLETSYVNEKSFLDKYCQDKIRGCEVDASVYYRFSWFQFGFSYMLENPSGVGNVDHPLAVALEAKYGKSEEKLFNDFHSETLNLGVKFGLFTFILIYIVIIFLIKFLLMKNESLSDGGDLTSICALIVITEWISFDTIGFRGLMFSLIFVLIIFFTHDYLRFSESKKYNSFFSL